LKELENVGSQKKTEIGANPVNKQRNRYKNILPCKYHHIILQVKKETVLYVHMRLY